MHASLPTRIPHWTELGESERYWAGYLARYAEDHNMVKEWHFGSHAFLTEACDTPFDAWLIESLLTALTHGEKRFALRAMFQAIRYNEKTNNPGHLQDAVRCAQKRVTDFLAL